jgi:signal transduction histidine kinase
MRTRFTMGAAALLGVIALFIYLYFPRRVEQQAFASIDHRAKSIAQMTAYNVSAALFLEQPQDAEEVFEGARRNPDLHYLVVTDASDKVFAAYSLFGADRARFREFKDSPITPDHAVYRVAAPVENGGRIIGWAYLGLSLNELNGRLRAARVHIAIVSLVVFLIGVLAAFLMTTLLTQPLRNIMRTVERVSAGDLSQRTEVTTGGEVGYLGRSFDTMVARLESAYGALQSANRDLEERVAERTRELRHEIEERAELEEKLRQSQKLEAVGRLAGGIAHDFNNLLTTINGLAQVLITEHDTDKELKDDLQEILKAGERATALTGQLLAFSRRQVVQLQVLDLKATIRDMVAMLRRMIGSDIELLLELSEDTHSVHADPGQITQVLMNLALNARDAMPGGGRLSIEMRNVWLDATRAADVGVANEGWFVKLVVSDSGHGMDDETRQRIFEPFFTTKEQGKGTGLGLSTVYGIMKQSGGGIAVETSRGKGASFTLYLPSLGRSVETQAPSAERGPNPGTETVLLAEDEDAVRLLVGRVLKKAGYTVLEAGNGVEALASFRTHAGRIDAVVTDVIMPQMSGPELVRRLLVEKPSLRVLYMSGYTQDEVLDDGLGRAGTAFLQKPMTPLALTRKLRELLEERLPEAGIHALTRAAN